MIKKRLFCIAFVVLMSSCGSASEEITFQEISKVGLKNLGQTIMTLAEAEELSAHRNAVSIRINNETDES